MKFRFSEYELDTDALEVRLLGERIEVPPLPLRLLCYLARHSERVVRKEELLQAVWGDVIVGEGSLAAAIRKLRRILDRHPGRSLIETRRGFGYRLCAPVTELADESALPDSAPEPSFRRTSRVRSEEIVPPRAYLAPLIGGVCYARAAGRCASRFAPLRRGFSPDRFSRRKMDDDRTEDLNTIIARLPRELRAIVMDAPAALSYVDRHQRFRCANRHFLRWVGADRLESVVGRCVADLSDHYDDIRPHVERALSGRAVRHEERIPGPDGEMRWVRTVLVPDVCEGEVQGYVLMQTDVTRSKEAEQALARERQEYAQRLETDIAQRTAQLREMQQRLLVAERLSAAEEMAGVVAHAINNPLAALLGTVEMAQQDMLAPGAAFERIRGLGKRIEEVVQRTLWMYRQGEVSLLPEPPAALLESLRLELGPRADAAEVTFVCKVEDDLPPVFADRTLLCSALGGIVENAIQASPPHGTVWLEAEPVRGGRIVRIRVSDEGPGIPPELRARVLEPFFTTKRGGTGFGLAIAAAVVQGHGGTLRIQDRPGGGSCVEVELLTDRGGGRPSTVRP